MQVSPNTVAYLLLLPEGTEIMWMEFIKLNEWC